MFMELRLCAGVRWGAATVTDLGPLPCDGDTGQARRKGSGLRRGSLGLAGEGPVYEATEPDFEGRGTA